MSKLRKNLSSRCHHFSSFSSHRWRIFKDRFFSQGISLFIGWRTGNRVSGHTDSFHSEAEQTTPRPTTRCTTRNRISSDLHPLWGMYEIVLDQYASALFLGIWLLGLMDA